MNYTILAADDEVELLDALELFLHREKIRLVKAADGMEALVLFRKENPDLVLLDVMMPELDGFMVLRKIRETSHVPAIMMTARAEDYNKILGLELGADDYITKPYNPMEVVARVKAQLRRNYTYGEAPEKKETSIKRFDLVLDTESCTVQKNGNTIALTKTEYLMLHLFMKSPGRIFTKQQIFEYAWEDLFGSDESTVMVHISNLRAKIEEDPKKPVMLKTIKGLGYKFEKEK
ncbi:response regulator transcription factor [Gorillibacterium massiliense]|uniref:response regulator transcription factor n=1 Tax=Gorillibacterium massiliense TaxID=1280390 RepID=UPI0004ACF397|nr:response regulator transcription factor [Gorillibacterium massiliense]